jgi:hypothetical protein
MYIATKNMPNTTAPKPEDYSKFWPGFIVDCWLANWNVVGNNMTNIKMDKGKPIRMDISGVMKYRAIGQPKPFTSNVTETDTLVNPSVNKDSFEVFKNITEDVWKKSVAKLASIENSKLQTYVKTFGPGSDSDKQKLFEVLVERKDKLIAYKLPAKGKSPVKSKGKSPVKSKAKSPAKSKAKSPVKSKGKLVNVNLSSKNLTEIPQNILEIAPAIRELNLTGNKLTQLPKEIGNMVNLEKLLLNKNQLTELPKEIGKLKKLKSLSLFDNKVTQLPKEIGDLTNLEELVLARQKLTQLPESLRNSASKITRLYVQENKLTELPDWIGEFTNLEILNVANNPLKKLPDSMSKLQKLQILNISYTNITSLPLSMKKLTNLKYITYKNHIMEKIANISSSIDFLNMMLSNVVDKNAQAKTKCKLDDPKYLKNPQMYICNEKTGNWVKKHGEVGYNPKPNKPVNPAQAKTKCNLDNELYLKNPDLYICNEKTGKWVKKHGDIGKLILQNKK